MTSLRCAALLLVPALSLLAAACTTQVDAESEPVSTGCSEPEPPAGGWCPASWTCIDGEWVDGAGACPDPCPEVRPADGTACDPIGVSCTYPGEDIPCGPPATSVQALCTEAGWVTMMPKCQPEPECPDALPVHGGDCTGWDSAYFCSYQVETGCGAKSASAYCSYESGTGMLWVVEMPETCASCAELSDPASCSASPSCRWLEPGCGEPPLSQAGCFPAADCDETSCGLDALCSPVDVDPCWNAPCDACSSPALVCLPDPGA